MNDQQASESMTYLGRNPCGCVGVLTVDSPERKRQVAKDVAAMIRDGMSVERIPTESVRQPGFSLAPCVDNPNCVRLPKERRAAEHQETML